RPAGEKIPQRRSRTARARPAGPPAGSTRCRPPVVAQGGRARPSGLPHPLLLVSSSAEKGGSSQRPRDKEEGRPAGGRPATLQRPERRDEAAPVRLIVAL